MTKTYLLHLSLFTLFFAVTPSAQCMFNNKNTKMVMKNIVKWGVIGTATASLTLNYGKNAFKNDKKEQTLNKLDKYLDTQKGKWQLYIHIKNLYEEDYIEQLKQSLINYPKDIEERDKNSEDAPLETQSEFRAILKQLGVTNPNIRIKMIPKSEKTTSYAFTDGKNMYINPTILHDSPVNLIIYYHEGSHVANNDLANTQKLQQKMLKDNLSASEIKNRLDLNDEKNEKRADIDAIEESMKTPLGRKAIFAAAERCNDQFENEELPDKLKKKIRNPLKIETCLLIDNKLKKLNIR